MKKIGIETNFPHPMGYVKVTDIAEGINHRYQVDLHNVDPSKWDLLDDAERAEVASAIASATQGKLIDPHAPSPFPEPSPENLLAMELARTDKDMARVAEDWIAAIAAANPAALTWIKENRPDGLEKVNARRVLRGETPL